MGLTEEDVRVQEREALHARRRQALRRTARHHQLHPEARPVLVAEAWQELLHALLVAVLNEELRQLSGPPKACPSQRCREAVVQAVDNPAELQLLRRREMISTGHRVV